MNVEFLDEFDEVYRRNNKSSTTKNLRCFPGCKPAGHSQYGFCGNAVRVRVEVNGVVPVKSLYAWGDFFTHEPNLKEDFDVDISLNSIAELESRERTKKRPLNNLIRGEVVTETSSGSNEVTLIFNREYIGWHYQWVSKKNTNLYFHSFRIRLYSFDGTRFVLHGVACSPTFQIFSRRKAILSNKARRANKVIMLESPFMPKQPLFQTEVEKYKQFFPENPIGSLISEELLREYHENEVSIIREHRCLLKLQHYFFFFPPDKHGSFSADVPFGQDRALFMSSKETAEDFYQNSFSFDLPSLDLFPEKMPEESPQEQILRKLSTNGVDLVKEASELEEIGKRLLVFIKAFVEHDTKGMFDYWLTPQNVRKMRKALDAYDCLWQKDLEIDASRFEYFVFQKMFFSLSAEDFIKFVSQSPGPSADYVGFFSATMTHSNTTSILQSVQHVSNLLDLICENSPYLDQLSLHPLPKAVPGLFSQMKNLGLEMSPLELSRGTFLSKHIHFGQILLRKYYERERIQLDLTSFTQQFEKLSISSDLDLSVLSGEWRQTPFDTLKKDRFASSSLGKVLRAVVGFPVFRFMVIVFGIQFKKTELKLLQNKMVVQVNDALPTESTFVFNLNGKPEVCNFPPMRVTEGVDKRRVVSWIQENRKDYANIRIVYSFRLKPEAVEGGRLVGKLPSFASGLLGKDGPVSDTDSFFSSESSQNGTEGKQINGPFVRLCLDLKFDKNVRSSMVHLSVFTFVAEEGNCEQAVKRSRVSDNMSYTNRGLVAPPLEETKELEPLFLVEEGDETYNDGFMGSSSFCFYS
eukprot:snap_masked-scaffold_34-processed-gene-3.27-mRNA-1 protein AED:1.00 eAED:1.00 QI:0/0/0/0/1/1/2/0/805